MKYLKGFNLFIFEKSSLTNLGVPKDVMQIIQKNYEIPSKSTWTKIKYKKDLKEELLKQENALYIEIGLDYIKIFANIKNDYVEQKFKYEDDGWGGVFKKQEKEDVSLSNLLKHVSNEHLIYKLDTSDFKISEYKERKLKKTINEFRKTSENFKMNIIRKFSKIIKKIYGKKYNDIIKQIAKNFNKSKPSTSLNDIMEFLNDNQKLASVAKDYDNALKNDKKVELDLLKQQYNSLTIIDEKLLEFEVGYSEILDKRVTIKDLIDEYGLMPIETAFLYYLYTDKIKKLNNTMVSQKETLMEASTEYDFVIDIKGKKYYAKKIKGINKYIAFDEDGNRINNGLQSSKKDFIELVKDGIRKQQEEKNIKSQEEKNISGLSKIQISIFNSLESQYNILTPLEKIYFYDKVKDKLKLPNIDNDSMIAGKRFLSINLNDYNDYKKILNIK